MVQRFNRTLKTILRKHAARFGNQWDRYLSGVLWAYRNTPHDSTSEKPSFLLFGHDLRTPTEACFLPASPVYGGAVEDYREELMVSLSSARELAVENLQKAQEKYKRNYDHRVSTPSSPMKCGDWVLVHFPHEESGPNRKLSRPWHGPYRIISVNDPDLSMVKVYFLQDQSIQVHQSRVKVCPPNFPSGFYWYGGKRRGPGRPPKWVSKVLNSLDSEKETEEPPTGTPESQVEQSLAGDDSRGEDGPTDTTSGLQGCKFPLRNRATRSGRT